MTDAGEVERLVAWGVALSAKIESHKVDTAILSAERVAVVRALRGHGWSYGRIAEAMGLSRARIAQIVN